MVWFFIPFFGASYRIVRIPLIQYVRCKWLKSELGGATKPGVKLSCENNTGAMFVPCAMHNFFLIFSLSALSQAQKHENCISPNRPSSFLPFLCASLKCLCEWPNPFKDPRTVRSESLRRNFLDPQPVLSFDVFLYLKGSLDVKENPTVQLKNDLSLTKNMNKSVRNILVSETTAPSANYYGEKGSIWKI